MRIWSRRIPSVQDTMLLLFYLLYNRAFNDERCTGRPRNLRKIMHAFFDILLQRFSIYYYIIYIYIYVYIYIYI